MKKHLVLSVLLIGSPVLAADRYFTGTGTADFNVAGNWDAGGVPGTADVLFFNTAFSNMVFSADAENASAVFSGTRTNRFNTGAYTWRLNQKAVIAQGEATVVRFNGGKYVFEGLIATNADETGSGSARFEFANGELTTSGDVYLWAPTNGFAANMSPAVIGGDNNSDSFVWNVTNGTVYIRTFGLLNTSDGRNNVLWIGNQAANSKTVLNLKGPNTVLTNNNWTHVGRDGSTDKRDCVLSISEGAKMYNAGALFVGWRGTGNRVFVSGTNSLLNNGMGLTVAKNSAGGTGNRVYITTGGVVRCTTVGIQEGDAPADYESGGKIVVAGPGARLEASALVSLGGTGLRGDLQVLDGGMILVTGNTLKMGNGANGSLHRLIIDGPGSYYKATGGNVYFEGVTNSIAIRNGGTLEFTAAKPNIAKDGYSLVVSDPGSSLISMGLAASGDVFVAVTNGATAFLNNGIDMGYTSGKTTRFLIDGTGSVVSNALSSGTPFIRLGCTVGAFVDFSVRNGGGFVWAETNSSWGVSLGWSSTGAVQVAVENNGLFKYTGRSGGTEGSVVIGREGVGTFLVRNSGQAVFRAGGVNVGMVDYSAGSALDVSSGGFLDTGVAAMRVYGYAGNRISVNDSVWQLAKSNPTVTVDAGSSGIGFTNSVLAFRKCSGVNILDNKTGRFNVFAWGGDNTFRLNGATNNTQNYTFGKTADPTDYVNLELFNGARFNGDVTVNQGRLGLAGTNAVNGNLTLNTGAALALSDTSPLTVAGTLSAAPDTVTVSLSAAPQVNAQQTLITAGGISDFPAQTVVQVFDGKSYEITLSAVGNRIVAGYYTGTVIRLY